MQDIDTDSKSLTKRESLSFYEFSRCTSSSFWRHPAKVSDGDACLNAVYTAGFSTFCGWLSEVGV